MLYFWTKSQNMFPVFLAMQLFFFWKYLIAFRLSFASLPATYGSNQKAPLSKLNIFKVVHEESALQRQTGQRYVKAHECTGDMCRKVGTWGLAKQNEKPI